VFSLYLMRLCLASRACGAPKGVIAKELRDFQLVCRVFPFPFDTSVPDSKTGEKSEISDVFCSVKSFENTRFCNGIRFEEVKIPMTKNFSLLVAAAFAFCLLLGVSQILAQASVTGGVNGKVSDPQGAIVPNVSVKVTNNGTNASVSVTSNADGVYTATNLQPGTYTIEANASGFAPAKAEHVIVEVGRSTNVDFPLTIGTAVAEVQITSEAPVINTSDNANASNFNQTSINELPINGRRWSNFAILSPSAVPDATFGLISFRGISGLLNNNTIDGGDNNQAFFSEERGRTRINYVISQSAIREFQVNTSNYSAEYGRSAGGVTNAVTKSGTNEFHGEAFYYNRNNRNGARNPRAFQTVLVGGIPTILPAKPIDLRQQWGGTIGGPIVKDKLFFFFSYDQQSRNFPGLAAFSNASFLNLTPAQQTALTGPGNGTAGGGAGLSQNQVNHSIAFLTSLTGQTPRKGDQTLFLPKLDWHINNSNVLTASYNRLRWKSPNGIQTQAVNTFARSSFGDDFVKVDSVNVRLQSNISSNLLNEARFQYGRDFEYEFSTPPLPGEPPTSSTSVGGVRSPDVSITGGVEFGTPTFLERPRYPDERRIQFADTMTYIHGRHTLKFGADFNHVSDDFINLRFEAGSYFYGNIADFIIDYENWVLPNTNVNARCSGSTGLPGKCYTGTTGYQQGIGAPGLKLSTNDWNFFVQDDFRINSRLTVNLGLRYEYLQAPNAVIPNSSTAVIPNDGRTLAEATSTMPSDKNNFGPRIGFAYDVFGDGKTSLRGGYGIYYGRIQSSTISNALINTGNPAGQAQVSFAATTAGAPSFPNILPANNITFRAGGIQFFSRDFQAPLINQYDIVLEREIMKNTVASVSYIGSLGRNLPTFVDQNWMLNPTTPSKTWSIFGGELNGTTFTFPLYQRANTSFGALTRIESTVKSEYNGVVFQINRRFTDGLQFGASYTLAKATDTNQNSATFTQTNSPLDLFNRSYDAGPSTLDVRHKVVVNAVYAPTFYKGSTKSFYNYLLNGWTFAPIYTFYSGKPFDGTVSTSLNGTSGNNRFPLNPRNAYRLPNLWNLDARLSKRFKLTENMNLELLAEAFNLTNRTQVFGVATTLYTAATNCAATNGIVTNNPNGLCRRTDFNVEPTVTDSTLYRERQIQFAARFQF